MAVFSCSRLSKLHLENRSVIFLSSSLHPLLPGQRESKWSEMTEPILWCAIMQGADAALQSNASNGISSTK